jgi:hypothetical protein
MDDWLKRDRFVFVGSVPQARLYNAIGGLHFASLGVQARLAFACWEIF